MEDRVIYVAAQVIAGVVIAFGILPAAYIVGVAILAVAARVMEALNLLRS